MISQLVGAITKDTLAARSRKGLPKGYLAPVHSYVEKVDDQTFVDDLSAILELLAENTSVIAAAARLEREKNSFFLAILDALPQVRGYASKETNLGQYLTSIEKVGSQYQQILVREMQTLLLQATNTDSAIVQIATEVDTSELDITSLPGIPQVKVNKSLIGGVRVFHDGNVRDDSWRARLTQILSAVTNV
ncbi:hypothetical protein HON52_00985 [Candidatus Uhrbacteria bacterium]|jgi:F0F1-type ATP synthase delta subunit|nr:hypothetical protein [Candidatus Uhrbacteria bacterium]